MSGPLPLALGYDARVFGDFPQLTNINCVPEKNSTDQAGGIAMVGRYGLEAFSSVGNGPFRGVYQTNGRFNNDSMIVSGQTLYRMDYGGNVTAISGTVPGSERVSMAAITSGAAIDELRITANEEGIFLFQDDVTPIVEEETFPDGQGVSSVLELKGFLFACALGTGLIYTRISGDTVWGDLEFTGADYKPDAALGIYAIGDQVLVASERSHEIFALTGTAATPLAPYGAQMAWPIGCANRDAVVTVFIPDPSEPRSATISVSDKGEVYEFSPQPKLISPPWLTEKLRNTSRNTFRACGFNFDNKAFYALTCADGTFVCELTNRLWSVWNTAAFDFWIAQMALQIGARVMMFDARPNNTSVYLLTPDLHNDASDWYAKEVTAFLDIKEGEVFIDNLCVNMATGRGPRTGQGSDPILMICASRDGFNFGAWRHFSIGQTGNMKGRVKANRWGKFGTPGALFRIRCSEPMPFRVSSVMANVVE